MTLPAAKAKAGQIIKKKLVLTKISPPTLKTLRNEISILELTKKIFFMLHLNYDFERNFKVFDFDLPEFFQSFQKCKVAILY